MKSQLLHAKNYENRPTGSREIIVACVSMTNMLSKPTFIPHLFIFFSFPGFSDMKGTLLMFLTVVLLTVEVAEAGCMAFKYRDNTECKWFCRTL